MYVKPKMFYLSYMPVFLLAQLIVQRCLSARNIMHAKGGTLFASALKFLSLPMFVLPGMVSRVLYPSKFRKLTIEWVGTIPFFSII